MTTENKFFEAYAQDRTGKTLVRLVHSPGNVTVDYCLLDGRPTFQESMQHPTVKDMQERHGGWQKTTSPEYYFAMLHGPVEV